MFFWLRIGAEDLGIWLRLRAFCLNIRGNVSYAGTDCAGMQPSEGSGKVVRQGGGDKKGFLRRKGRYGHVVSSGVCFPYVCSGVMMKGRGDSHGVAGWLIGG